uniref:ATP synthase complex subunit 8 n=1 Tax=Plestiodon chinensis TaxID=463516 RepID=A0A0U4KCU2_PLECH|nr:ATP synthase F0 subunit 8 [Plestiodon chinensis]ALY11249.1 ATP synthase F0 subunit 8 [Plestiodon chinensis]
MPQLNPAPWFLTLLLAWTLILLIFKTKILSSASYSTPTPKDPSTHHTTPWNWPWT